MDEKYMRRALELAAKGAGFVSPNPQVGAVVVAPDGRIIGEGWHRRYGGPHAEVNAIASVKDSDLHLLKESTVYVSLEPCSHYGKTPPCSKLLIDKGVKRVVVGMGDPFKEVSGRGIAMLRDAGIEVIENVLEEECREINRRFITAHTLRRPWVLLKWAQSADHFIARLDKEGKPRPVKLSNPLSQTLMHRERTLCDAILVGTNTVIADNPRLEATLWPGNNPRPVLFGSPSLPTDAIILQRNPIFLDPEKNLEENLSLLYRDYKITSLMVEGGRKILDSFISANLFDEIRIETNPMLIKHGISAPSLPPDIRLLSTRSLASNLISTYRPNSRI